MSEQIWGKWKTWSKVFTDREAWRRIVEQVKICRVSRKEDEDKRNHLCFWNHSVLGHFFIM